jgi:hypothetical protein
MTSVPQQQPSPSKFVELSENECIKLLADHTPPVESALWDSTAHRSCR